MKLRAGAIVTALLVVALGFVAWFNNRERMAGDESAAPPPAGGPVAGAPAPASETDPGVTWTVPRGWITEITGGMRLATYIVPGAEGKGDAECAVYYFGPGAGGGVDANLERWVGEFSDHTRQNTRHREVRGMKIATLELAGTFAGHTMRTDAEAGPHPDWGLLGAIVRGPSGDLFFKMTGPAATVDAAAKPFDAMLGSLRPR